MDQEYPSAWRWNMDRWLSVGLSVVLCCPVLWADGGKSHKLFLRTMGKQTSAPVRKLLGDRVRLKAGINGSAVKKNTLDYARTILSSQLGGGPTDLGPSDSGPSAFRENRKEASMEESALAEQILPPIPEGPWRDSARNIQVHATRLGSVLKADMLCEGATRKQWVHVEMLYVPSLTYRWEFQKIDERSPTCRFTWDNNNGIVKTWDLSGQKEKKKQWFNPVTNPQYLYQIAPPLSLQEVLTYQDAATTSLFTIREKVEQIPRAKKVVALSLFAPEGCLASWQQAGQSWIEGRPIEDNRYLSELAKNLDRMKKRNKGYVVHVYLSENLAFLEKALLAYSNVNLYYMQDSPEPNPGSMWRFLSLSNPHADFVHVRDTDQRWTVEDFVEREQALLQYDKAMAIDFFRGDTWADNRAAIWRDVIAGGEFSVRPRALRLDNMAEIMSGYIGLAESRRDAQNPYAFHDEDPITYWNHPSLYRGNNLGFGKTYPAYSFDQGFLKYVIYPEVVERQDLMMMHYRWGDGARVVGG